MLATALQSFVWDCASLRNLTKDEHTKCIYFSPTKGTELHEVLLSQSNPFVSLVNFVGGISVFMKLRGKY